MSEFEFEIEIFCLESYRKATLTSLTDKSQGLTPFADYKLLWTFQVGNYPLGEIN